MKPIVRKVRRVNAYSYDVILPKQIVEELGLEDSYVAIFVKDGDIVLRKIDLKKVTGA